MALFEYICRDCEVILEIEKPSDRKGQHCICPHCHGVLVYTGCTLKKDQNQPRTNVVHLADFRLSKKGLD